MGLHQRLATGEGDTASGLFEEQRVLPNDFEYLSNCHTPAQKLPGIRGTRIGAIPAQLASLCIAFDVSIQMKGLVSALRNAFTTPDAAVLQIDHFRPVELTLGIVAPGTAQWTAFEENGGANSGSVMERKAHHVEDEAKRLGVIMEMR
jgi:hypothetical protein